MWVYTCFDLQEPDLAAGTQATIPDHGNATVAPAAAPNGSEPAIAPPVAAPNGSGLAIAPPVAAAAPAAAPAGMPLAPSGSGTNPCQPPSNPNVRSTAPLKRTWTDDQARARPASPGGSVARFIFTQAMC